MSFLIFHVAQYMFCSAFPNFKVDQSKCILILLLLNFGVFPIPLSGHIVSETNHGEGGATMGKTQFLDLICYPTKALFDQELCFVI